MEAKLENTLGLSIPNPETEEAEVTTKVPSLENAAVDSASNPEGTTNDAKEDPASASSGASPSAESLSVQPSTDAVAPQSQDTPVETPDDSAPLREAAPMRQPRGKAATEKKEPYVNIDRVKTGGGPRDKLSEEELAVRMARIKQQNAEIIRRRQAVEADMDAFQQRVEKERVRYTRTREVQNGINRTRAANALNKLAKAEGREWDSGKPPGDWTQENALASGTGLDGEAAGEAATGLASGDGTGRADRGQYRGRGGRSRGRGWRGGRGRSRGGE